MDLPVGISDFKELVEYKNPITKQGLLYVDKTLFIKEILKDSAKAIILTRPRRFGKTLNLSMLHHFFANEVLGSATKGLFDNLEIAKDFRCMEYQGKYPVVVVSFKDVKQLNFKFCLENIASVIAKTYRQHREALNSVQMLEDDKAYIKNILELNMSQVKLEHSLSRLLELLFKYYNKKIILLIDEYDTPIQEAYLNGYYSELITFFRNFLSAALKDENNLHKAILSGILRVSKESLFSGLSNIKVYSLLDQKYCSYFGFTEEEVQDLFYKAQLPCDLHQTKEWYNGYNFGGITIYNPWSIINFIKDEGKRLKSYWINTSGNELVKNIIINSSFNVQEKIGTLVAGYNIKEYIDEQTVFTDLTKNPDAIWGLLLMAGYLKYTSYEDKGKRTLCELRLPNNEISNYYTSVIEEWITGDRGFNWYVNFINDLREGKIEHFAEKLQTLVEETLSFHDVGKKSQESFYHGLMLAFITGLKGTHFISSNKESGEGRYDLALIPFDVNALGILIEIKATNNKLKLEEEAKKALMQIQNSNYVAELKLRGITRICSIGISFSGKAVKVLTF